ncbi:isoleucine--tRNA ligase [Bacillus cytotoxicus]|uniref:Isoleucine--tRNA ligase n=2 Tax=Bacillus cytotoxicus TaxID=580165 RepID=SYI_BACCN|nr:MULTISPECIES: isoleucine--tRNA ligase [Bacillus cereus group]A7GRM0.1 RecName: Full=Isoleucine--tRNA ligase; AltName: Full=Isoleucyl-tRNA synthetase; Short=IleRS [Bacillus cytotoxicus NVH 391-98]ABS22778.1 isoleucyl-tRNA synthetase [Bacillus cytotoxicus NVH 391-98]AWC29442.1 isoleucine--tRNA ligase [Bacillus cytotoxicus]AWC33455.1 isoleucine--tRNA ligase [Bacillus cytotoxicus]AWC37433.1 isoleucine--tRNA ligase [Bacillus cytotoxicus]AWC41573.1 isoleucine--tRNA ligase [Bacillus cytotoxicus]
MEYKNTLLMPKTEFPMRGNLPKREPAIQEKWAEMNIYEKVQERTKGRPLFVLHDGPPYANGDIHMGHALNKVLKDFIVRYKSMTGYCAPYVPGWDTHGLPIEQALTNKGVKRKEMPVAEFRKLCAEYAYEQVNRQREQFKRLGVRADWDHPYITLEPAYEAQQIKVFGEMAKKGYIYKGQKPVYWSPTSESALAEAEIEYKDKKSASIYVAFEVKDGKDVLEGDEKFIIWTTTPWTLPANLGISVHPKLEYSIVKVNDEKYIIASDLFDTVAKTLEWENPEVVRTVKGSELEYTVAKHPFYDRDSLVMLGEHVTTDAGTGCVHTAPGHGEDDFIVGQKYGLEVLCPVDDKGVLTSEAPGFEGLFYDKANKPITEKLEEVGALLKLTFITHSYPHDWRTKKPIIFRATAQWFASIEAFRSELLQAVKETKWVPAWGETRLHNMVRDRGDWCISRQRAWGVPIPVFYAENNDPIITDETINHVANLFREHGSNVWFEREAKDLLPEGFTHPSSPNGEFRKETDIMDVWFDSGSSHQAVLEERDDLQRPADLYLEGSDQYRGWFNSSLSTAVAVTGKAPYKGVLSHGFVLDGEGRKMSKSIGNIVVPKKIMDQLGGDILRLWVSSVDYQSDVRISDDILKQVAEVYRKIRNTFRFLLGNLADFNPAQDAVAKAELREVDRYMLVKLNDLITKVKEAYETYDFAAVYHAIHNFCTIDLSSFYLDFAKDILYIEAANHHDRRAIQTVLYDVLVALTKLVTPILPHTADEVWPYIPGVTEESVQLTDMPEAIELQDGEALKTKWDAFMTLRSDVLKALEVARNEKVIGKSLTASITLFPTAEMKEMLESIQEDLKQLFIVSEYKLGGTIEEAPADAQKYEHTAVLVTQANGETCERCWVVSETVGNDNEYKTLCERCATVVKENYVK